MVARMPDDRHSQLADQLASLSRTDEREQAKERAHKVHLHVLEQLLGRDWSQLQVLEEAGSLMFRETLYRRGLDGGFKEEPVYVRVPRLPDRRRARVAARKWALEEGLDLDRDAELVDDMETLWIMTLCIHNADGAEDPRPGVGTFHEQWVGTPQELEKRYDMGSLMQLWAKMDALGQVVDPRINTIEKEEMLALIAGIAKSRTIDPLHVYGPGAQKDCIVFMAEALLSSLESKS